MAGAWELLERTSLLVGILHVDTTSIAWSLGFRNLQIPGGVLAVSGMPYDHARNEICRAGLANGFEWIGMLDSDVIPPADAFLKLISRQQPIISGIYCRRSPPAGVPVMMRNGQWVTEYPKDSIIEVDVVGSGLLLIHRTVLEKMTPSRPGKPYFDWRVDLKGAGEFPDNECMSEDFTFCNNARKQGYKILVDTSIMARHVGLAQATYGSLVPVECLANT